MISLRDVVTGFGNRDPLAEVWRRSLRGGGGGSAVITGVPPLRYIGDGRPLTDYLIAGNTVQDGTPSADAPAEVQGCGVRTGNLWDGGVPEYVYAKDYKKYNPNNAVTFPAGTYTISSDGRLPTIQAFDASHTQLEIGNVVSYATPYYRVWDGFAIGPMTGTARTTTITLLSDCILTFTVTDNFGSYIMLNLGSTALPYEPYGFKLPLTVNGTEYPIYLGQVQTTRRIKKLVLTGKQSDGNTNITAQGIICITPLQTLKSVRDAYCTHYKYVNQKQGAGMPSNSFTTSGGTGTSLWFKTEYQTVADFKSYLASQYAAGTPVTVWYVLAEPETAVVNEPLMKIGDYADTVSFAQAGVAIPTVNGANVLDVPTEVPPSEITIKGGISSV